MLLLEVFRHDFRKKALRCARSGIFYCKMAVYEETVTVVVEIFRSRQNPNLDPFGMVTMGSQFQFRLGFYRRQNGHDQITSLSLAFLMKFLIFTSLPALLAFVIRFFLQSFYTVLEVTGTLTINLPLLIFSKIYKVECFLYGMFGVENVCLLSLNFMLSPFPSILLLHGFYFP